MAGRSPSEADRRREPEAALGRFPQPGPARTRSIEARLRSNGLQPLVIYEAGSMHVVAFRANLSDSLKAKHRERAPLAIEPT